MSSHTRTHSRYYRTCSGLCGGRFSDITYQWQGSSWGHSSHSWPMIAKRHSITLWCSDHTQKNQFTCVHLCTCVDYRSHHAVSLCPWGTRIADDYKWTSTRALAHKLQLPKYISVKVLVPSGWFPANFLALVVWNMRKRKRKTALFSIIPKSN